MKNEFSSTVIFGDYFTIETEVKTGRQGIIRDYEINSEGDLQEYLKENNDLAMQLKASKHHYFNWMAPQCSKTLAEFWSDYNYRSDIIQISEWSVSQLEHDNMVYFGQSKSMGVLKNILVESFPHYIFKSQRLIRKNPVSQKMEYYGDIVAHDDKIVDYTIVAKVQMPTGNEVRFFLSDQDCGAISALQYFTQNDSIRAFYKRHELKPEDDFIALFKVTGWHRKSYEMEFVVLDRK